MKKNIRKVFIVTVILLVVGTSVIYVVGEIMKNNQWFRREELTQTASGEKSEMMADVSAEEEEMSDEEKISKMKKLSENWDNNKVHTENINLYNEKELTSDKEQVQVPVPVPVGYTASDVEGENTVDGGFVIYEGEEPVTGKSDSEPVKTAKKNRNQWVWVPIYDANEIYGTDSNGQLHGKLYDYSSNNKRTPYNWSEEGDFMTMTSSFSYKEPALLTDYDKDYRLGNYLIEENREELDKDIQEDFKTTIESIKKYGGFYIGRYETGGLSGEAKVVKQNEDISNQTWYTMYEKGKELGEENDSIETSMIWGCLWDATLQWLIDTDAATYDEVGKNSKDWGNYANVSFQYEDMSGNIVSKRGSKIIPTGSSEHNNKNNIYDMAGNVYEITLEAYSKACRAYRGGYYVGNGIDSVCYRKYYGPNNFFDDCGTRLALFVCLSPQSDVQ